MNDNIAQSEAQSRDCKNPGVAPCYLDFKDWWFNYGSGIGPKQNEDHETHARKVSLLAWKASEASTEGQPLKTNSFAKTKEEKKLEDDIAFLGERLADYRNAFISIWDSVTDVLDQKDIDRIETVNSLDFRTLGR